MFTEIKEITEIILGIIIGFRTYAHTTIESKKLDNQNQLNMITICSAITGSVIECPGGIKITK